MGSPSFSSRDHHLNSYILRLALNINTDAALNMFSYIRIMYILNIITYGNKLRGYQCHMDSHHMKLSEICKSHDTFTSHNIIPSMPLLLTNLKEMLEDQNAQIHNSCQHELHVNTQVDKVEEEKIFKSYYSNHT
jgi:hypothetical protein